MLKAGLGERGPTFFLGKGGGREGEKMVPDQGKGGREKGVSSFHAKESGFHGKKEGPTGGAA